MWRSGQGQSELTTRGHALGDNDRSLIGIEPKDRDLELLPQSVLTLAATTCGGVLR
jgi:hypothetical protein